jgi:hypothetical protein
MWQWQGWAGQRGWHPAHLRILSTSGVIANMPPSNLSSHVYWEGHTNTQSMSWLFSKHLKALLSKSQIIITDILGIATHDCTTSPQQLSS